MSHPADTKYPAYTEELASIAEQFKKIGNKYDNPELLQGLKYS